MRVQTFDIQTGIREVERAFPHVIHTFKGAQAWAMSGALIAQLSDLLGPEGIAFEDGIFWVIPETRWALYGGAIRVATEEDAVAAALVLT